MPKQNNPKYSIIMATMLRPYKTAAADRPRKLRRAIESVIQQTFGDWELLIVCDGCPDSFEIAKEYITDTRIKAWLITEQPLWSGIPRNFGKFKATGEWVLYLDNDDTFGADHLKIINTHLPDGLAWAWFNDWRWSLTRQAWYENYCYIDKVAKHGTSNIVFRRTLDVSWPLNGDYAHDFHFVAQLRAASQDYYKLPTPQYYVCHIPDNILGRGYDV